MQNQPYALGVELHMQQWKLLRIDLCQLRAMLGQLRCLFERHLLHDLRSKLHLPQQRLHSQLPKPPIQPNCHQLLRLSDSLQRMLINHELHFLRRGIPDLIRSLHTIAVVSDQSILEYDSISVRPMHG